MRKNLAVLFAVTVMFAAVPMFGEVIFDPSTGIGFVGKGDVQLAFGWNNKQLQSNAGGVGFAYEATAKYVQSCIKIDTSNSENDKDKEDKTKDPHQVRDDRRDDCHRSACEESDHRLLAEGL